MLSVLSKSRNYIKDSIKYRNSKEREIRRSLSFHKLMNEKELEEAE